MSHDRHVHLFLGCVLGMGIAWQVKTPGKPK